MNTLFQSKCNMSTHITPPPPPPPAQSKLGYVHEVSLTALNKKLQILFFTCSTLVKENESILLAALSPVKSLESCHEISVLWMVKEVIEVILHKQIVLDVNSYFEF